MPQPFHDGLNITSLTKVTTILPVWFMEVDGLRLTLNTSQLLQYKQFQHAALEQGNRLYPPLNPKDWAYIVEVALRDLIIINSPPETPAPQPQPPKN